ncbi:hypothetical protein [Pseudomonas synxantha]|uniref:hypothetical protein n=1 Tax=Pseudomonas synxantha TaxID=47883 RepID=UPI00345E05CD
MPTENKVAPNIQLALDYSRSFADAKPDIGRTEKEHIKGLAGLLERTALENSGLQALLTAADERADVLKGLLKRARHRIANLSRAPVPFDDPLDGPVLHGIDDALCEHLYIHFGTEQPRRRCNNCNKLELVEGGGDEVEQRRQDDESLQRRDDDDRRAYLSDDD